MISFGGSLKELSDSLDYQRMNIDEWVDQINGTNYTIYLADSTIRDPAIKKRLYGENSIVISQRGYVEEFLSTIIGKVYFSEVMGYFVGDFPIPPIHGEDCYGIPDIIGLKGSFVNKLKAAGMIGDGGLLEDLPLWRYLRGNGLIVEELDEAIACEVKSSEQSTRAFDQLYYRKNDTHKPGYLKSRCFDKGYACYGNLNLADEGSSAKTKAGSLTFNGNPPYRFIEDPLASENVSNTRKKLQVRKENRDALIAEASRRSAHLLMVSTEIGTVFPGIEKMKLNAALKRINQAKVEDIIDKIS